ncbi:hypothetical protein BSKO_05126 [Bryopsis sp. KO-2023]|nr:hypothetical protein BSKO_05126 [Bryopsis sp. KO-2023]
MRVACRNSLLIRNFLTTAQGSLRVAGQCLDNPFPVEHLGRCIHTHGRSPVQPSARADVFGAPRRSISALPPSLAWYLNPRLKIIYGDFLFWYPMGNTPAMNLFEGMGSGPSSALLLGCGDVRNVFESCRQSDPAEKLVFALNDFNSSTIARDVLLFTIADEIDASKVRDVDFLWSVWYNLRLPRQDFWRLRKIVEGILDGSGKGKPWMKISGRDWKAVETVYRSWLVDTRALPDVRIVQKMRKERMLMMLNRGPVKNSGGQNWEEWKETLQEPYLVNVQDATLRERGRKDCAKYMETGSVSTYDPGDAEHFSPNVTLLDPQTRRWMVHYVSSPFHAYQNILRDENLRNAGGLVKACQRRLQEWVDAFQTRTRRASPTVEVSLDCSDALELCLSGGSSRTFDVIDTTNLADHVGLLNLVVCAGPLLSKKPGSRLSTATLTWASDNSSISEYLDKALSFNPKFAPTILGLRLVTDLERSQATSQRIMDRISRGNDEVRLYWEPAPSPSPPASVDDELIVRSLQSNTKIPQDPEPCAIGIQLARILRACCLLPLADGHNDVCGLQLSSPTTFALLLRNLGSRCILDTTANAPLPENLLEWCKKYCVSFGLEAEKVARLMDSSRGGLVEVRGQLRRNPLMLAMMKPTPTVRVALVHQSLWKKSTNIERVNDALVSDLAARHSSDMSLVHVIANILADEAGNVRFLLPEDHGLEASEWEVVLMDLDLPGGMSPHSHANMKSMEQSTFESPVDLVNEVTERGSEAGYLKEYGDRFVVRLPCNSPVQKSDIFKEFDQSSPGEPSLSVELGSPSAPDQSLKIDFPSPVVLHEASFNRLPSQQEIECIFPKSSVFSPINSGPTKLIDVANLPDFKNMNELKVKLAMMFSIHEMMYKHSEEDSAVSAVTVDPSYDLRSTISVLFGRLLEDSARVHVLYHDMEQGKSGEDPVMSLVVLGPVKRMEDGEPALLVTYVDHKVDLKARMKSGRFAMERYMSRFHSVLGEFGTKGQGIIVVGEEEVKLLRKMLKENAARLKPSRWQAKHVEEDSEWLPSFVKPVYPDNMKTGLVGSKGLRETMEKLSVTEAMDAVTKLATGGSLREAVTKHASGGFLREAGMKAAAKASSRVVPPPPENVEEIKNAVTCASCGTTSGLKRCGGCGKVWYCGRDCQKGHWGAHKHQCGKG